MKSRSREQAFMLPLAQLAAAFSAGVLVGHFMSLPLAFTITVGIVCALLSVIALLKRRKRTAAALVTLGFLLAAATLATLEQQIVRCDILKSMQAGTIRVGEPVELTGVLEREPEIARDRQYLTLRVERIASKKLDSEAPGRVDLFMPTASTSKQELDQLELVYGARIRVMTMLDREDKFRNPGVSSFTEYLDRKGIDATGVVKSPLLIERLENTRVFLPLALLYKWRSRLQARIDSHLSRETAGVLNAALLGNRYTLPNTTAERFREGGTFHVLVISGLHITFLGALVFFIVRQFTRNKLIQFLTSAAIVWGYSISVGAEASVVRAALMFTVVLLAPLVSRKASSLNALGGVAIVLLVWRPRDLLDPSFQLTFISVLAIVVFAWPIIEKVRAIGSWRPSRDTPYPPTCPPWLRAFSEALFWSDRRAKSELELSSHSYRLFKTPFAGSLERMHIQWLLRYVFAAFVVSASVQLLLLPFLVVYFHRLSLASFVLNITVSLLMAAVALTALAGLAIVQVSAALAQPLFHAANLLNWLMVHSVEPFERAGLGSIRLPEYTGWAAIIYVLYYLPLTVLVVLLFRWKPLQLARRATKTRLSWAFAATQVILIALVVFHPFSASHDGKLRIDFLDVGQGDAALITLPDRTTILVDGGGQPGPFKNAATQDDENLEADTRSIGESVVSEYLWYRGLDQVDYLVATHADADHIDGLNAVAKNFGARAVFVARTPQRDQEFAELAETLDSRNIPLRMLGGGDEIRIGDVSINVLLPTPSGNSGLPSTNNDSLVLQLNYGNRSFLMTADMEAKAEKSLLAQSADLAVDVVKVAHHGSRTSSSAEFISATKARLAIISVGQRSMFGHPHTEVVDRWTHSGAAVFTTGKRGTITFVTDGTNLEMSSFVQGGE